MNNDILTDIHNKLIHSDVYKNLSGVNQLLIVIDISKCKDYNYGLVELFNEKLKERRLDVN